MRSPIKALRSWFRSLILRNVDRELTALIFSLARYNKRLMVLNHLAEHFNYDMAEWTVYNEKEGRSYSEDLDVVFAEEKF